MRCIMPRRSGMRSLEFTAALRDGDGGSSGQGASILLEDKQSHTKRETEFQESFNGLII